MTIVSDAVMMLKAESLLNAADMLGLDLAELTMLASWVLQVGPERFAKIAVAVVEANGERRTIGFEPEHLSAMQREIDAGCGLYKAAGRVAGAAFANQDRTREKLPASEKAMAERLVQHHRLVAGSTSYKKNTPSAVTKAAIKRAQRRAEAAAAMSDTLMQIAELARLMADPALPRAVAVASEAVQIGGAQLSRLFGEMLGATSPK